VLSVVGDGGAAFAAGARPAGIERRQALIGARGGDRVGSAFSSMVGTFRICANAALAEAGDERRAVRAVRAAAAVVAKAGRSMK